MHNFDVSPKIWVPVIGAALLAFAVMVGVAHAPLHMRDAPAGKWADDKQTAREGDKYLVEVAKCATKIEGGIDLSKCSQFQILEALDDVLSKHHMLPGQDQCTVGESKTFCQGY